MSHCQAYFDEDSNLACSWCDTAWANVNKCDHEDMKPQSLVEWISDAGVSCVTLTGGEPTLQPGLPALILALLGSDAWGSGNGRAVEIETNGAVDLSALHELRSEFGKKRATDHCAAIDGIDCVEMPSSSLLRALKTLSVRSLLLNSMTCALDARCFSAPCSAASSLLKSFRLWSGMGFSVFVCNCSCIK